MRSSRVSCSILLASLLTGPTVVATAGSIVLAGAGLVTLAGSQASASVPGTQAAADSTAPRILEVDRIDALSKPERAAVFQEYVEAVRTALGQNDFARARDLAERATTLYPELRRPWLHLAAARLHLHQWGPAIEAARRADRAQDDSYPPAAIPAESRAAAAYWEGVALYQTQRFDEALPRLRAARQQAPDWAEAARALGEAAFVAGKLPEAATAYGAALQRDPQIGGANDLAYYADAQAEGGDIESAVAAVQEALRRWPYEAGLHAKLGDLLRREGNPVEAYYELMLELLVQGVEGPFAGPSLNMSQEIVKEARTDHKKPGCHELLVVSSALASLDHGDSARAIDQLLHVLKTTTTASLVPRLLLADAYLRAGKLDEARQDLESLLAAQPDFVPALYDLADVQRQAGDAPNADRSLEKVRATFPEYWKLHLEAGTRP